jgi:hypothetical protein
MTQTMFSRRTGTHKSYGTDLLARRRLPQLDAIAGPEPFRIAGPDEDAAETLGPLHDSSEIPPGTDL